MIISAAKYEVIREKSITGRYVSPQQIDAYLNSIGKLFKVREIGRSVQNRAIRSIIVGSGARKILMWSQMHGNESTTTKSMVDFINYFREGKEETDEILEQCTLLIIPLLNPDGAEAYTRVNANNVDLNRDAQLRTQPESRALRDVYETFRPDYCFNLHDQRTIYNVGNSAKPATVSFLSPAFNEERSLSATRLKSMSLISEMNRELQQVIPGQVGRYDDAFNPNCVGDTFQALETPTLLFEAGHFSGDYEREHTRRFIFMALLKAIDTVAKGKKLEFGEDRYFHIPENKKLYFDIVIRNAQVICPSLKKDADVGVLFKEILRKGKIHFKPEVDTIGNLSANFGHQEFDCLDPHSLKMLKKQVFFPKLFP